MLNPSIADVAGQWGSKADSTGDTLAEPQLAHRHMAQLGPLRSAQRREQRNEKRPAAGRAGDRGRPARPANLK